MRAHNADFAAIFTEIADLLEIQGENPCRMRAYRSAACGIGEYARDIASMITGCATLPKFAGIRSSILTSL